MNRKASLDHASGVDNYLHWHDEKQSREFSVESVSFFLPSPKELTPAQKIMASLLPPFCWNVRHNFVVWCVYLKIVVF